MRRLLAILVASLFAVTMLTAPAEATHSPYVSDKYYIGQRYYNGVKICVALNTSRAWLKTRTVEAVDDWNVHTNLGTFVRTDCSAYGQIVTIKAYYAGKTAWAGRVITTSRHWGKTAGGHWTYLTTRQTLELNLTYIMGYSSLYQDEVITHELGHALGALTHIDSNYSIMQPGWARVSGESQTIDRQAVNRIYAQ